MENYWNAKNLIKTPGNVTVNDVNSEGNPVDVEINRLREDVVRRKLQALRIPIVDFSQSRQDLLKTVMDIQLGYATLVKDLLNVIEAKQCEISVKNGEISELNNKVDDLQGDKLSVQIRNSELQTTNSELSGLRGENSTLQSRNSQLETENQKLRRANTTLKNELEKMEKKPEALENVENPDEGVGNAVVVVEGGAVPGQGQQNEMDG